MLAAYLATVVCTLFAGAAKVLGPEGVLVTYGPYSIDGDFLAPSNLDFDASLKSRNPEVTTLPMGTSSDLRVQLSGRPGLTYVLEQSTNLVNWAAVRTNALPLNGSGLATNTLPRLNPSHFLRGQVR